MLLHKCKSGWELRRLEYCYLYTAVLEKWSASGRHAYRAPKPVRRHSTVIVKGLCNGFTGAVADSYGDGNDSARLKAGRKQARGCSRKFLEERHTLYKFGIIYKIIRGAWLLIRHYVSVINSLGFLCTSLLAWINSVGRSPYALCLQTLELYLNLIKALCHGPEFRG
jgi:hypothetical protein